MDCFLCSSASMLPFLGLGAPHESFIIVPWHQCSHPLALVLFSCWLLLPSILGVPPQPMVLLLFPRPWPWCSCSSALVLLLFIHFTYFSLALVVLLVLLGAPRTMQYVVTFQEEKMNS
jgi:hypothetical protein